MKKKIEKELTNFPVFPSLLFLLLLLFTTTTTTMTSSLPSLCEFREEDRRFPLALFGGFIKHHFFSFVGLLMSWVAQVIFREHN